MHVYTILYYSRLYPVTGLYWSRYCNSPGTVLFQVLDSSRYCTAPGSFLLQVLHYFRYLTPPGNELLQVIYCSRDCTASGRLLLQVLACPRYCMAPGTQTVLVQVTGDKEQKDPLTNGNGNVTSISVQEEKLAQTVSKVQTSKSPLNI